MNLVCAKKNCNDQIDEESSLRAFSVFWKLASIKMQNAYLCGLFKQETPKIRHTRYGSYQSKSSSNNILCT